METMRSRTGEIVAVPVPALLPILWHPCLRRRRLSRLSQLQTQEAPLDRLLLREPCQARMLEVSLLPSTCMETRSVELQ